MTLHALITLAPAADQVEDLLLDADYLRSCPPFQMAANPLLATETIAKSVVAALMCLGVLAIIVAALAVLQ